MGFRSFFNQFPYTDFHELNLDFILGKIGTVEKSAADSTEAASSATESASRAATSAATATTKADAAAASADSARTASNAAYTYSANAAASAAAAEAAAGLEDVLFPELNSVNKITFDFPGMAQYAGVTLVNNGAKYTANGTATADITHVVNSSPSALPGGVRPGDLVTLKTSTTNSNMFYQVFFYVNGSWDFVREIRGVFQVVIPSGATGMLVRVCVKSGTVLNNDTLDNLACIMYESNGMIEEAFPIIIGDSGQTESGLITNVLAKYRVAYIGRGIHILDSDPIIMPDGSAIIGMGQGSVLRTNGGINAIEAGANCLIRDIKIQAPDPVTGTVGTTVGIHVAGNYDAAPEKGITQILNVKVEHFSKAGIMVEKTGYFVGNSVSVVNATCANNYAGIFTADHGEYGRYTNCNCYGNFVGCLNLSGNNVFTNCMFSNNTVGFYINGGDEALSANNGHGACIGCAINHSGNNTGYAVIVRGTNNGFTFDGCQFWYGKVQVQDASGVMFTDCTFGAYDTNAEIELYGTSYHVFVMNCLFKVGASFTGDAVRHVLNCYKFDGTEIS